MAGTTPNDRLAALVARCEAEPGLVTELRAAGDALAGKVGGVLELRWRIACVRALVLSPPDDDAVREAYGELVDRYRDDPSARALLKPLNEELRRLEADGTLASAMVARSTRRRPTNR